MDSRNSDKIIYISKQFNIYNSRRIFPIVEEKIHFFGQDGTAKSRPNDFAKNPEAGLTGSPEGL